MKMSDVKRQHPVMIILEAVRTFVYGLPPLFIFLLTMNGDIGWSDIRPYLGALVVFVIAFLSLSTLRWYLYTYRYEDGYLHIKRGLIFKKERSIKRERVQTVNIRTGLVQRLLGVATVQIETAGGGMESEIFLSAVKTEETQRIKSYLENKSRMHSEAVDEVTDAEPGTENLEEPRVKATYVVPVWNMFLAGATSGRFMLLFSVIAALFSQFYPYIPQNIIDYLIMQIIPASETDIFLIASILLLLLLISWLISIVVFMVQYANFTILRQDEYLRVSWGLIEQKEFTLKINRVQALSIQEGLMRQPIGLCSITSEVAGGGLREQDYVTIICPILRKKDLSVFLEQILPEYRIPGSMSPLPKRACKRYLFRATALVLILIIPLQMFPYGWLALLLLPPAFLLGLSRYRTGATVLDNKQLTLRFRNINRYQILIMQNHIQSLEISSNPFQRRSALSTVRAAVLSSPSGKTFKVVDVDNTEVGEVWDWFSRH